MSRDDDHCEFCGDLLPEDCYGWCADCDAIEKAARVGERVAMEEFARCICRWSTGEGVVGRSVCGLPCPVHKGETP